MSPMIPYQNWINEESSVQKLKVLEEDTTMTLAQANKNLSHDLSMINFTLVLSIVTSKKWDDKGAHDTINLLSGCLAGGSVMSEWALQILLVFNTDEAWQAIKDDGMRSDSSKIRELCKKELNVHLKGGRNGNDN